MNSSNGLLSGRSVKVLQKFEDDYLVEVFHPWNCDEQKLADTDTVLFRFKTRVALAGRDSSRQEKPRSWEAFLDFEGVWQGSTNRLACDNICWSANPLISVNSCVKRSLLQAIMDVLIVLGGLKLPVHLFNQVGHQLAPFDRYSICLGAKTIRLS